MDPKHCFKCKDVYLSYGDKCDGHDEDCDGCKYYDEYANQCDEDVVTFCCEFSNRIIADTDCIDCIKEGDTIQRAIDKNVLNGLYVFTDIVEIPKECPYYLEYLCELNNED